MPAPIGTVITQHGSLRELLTGEKPFFTKVGEGEWKHSHEEESRTVADGAPYDEAIPFLESLATGEYEGEETDEYSVALPESAQNAGEL